ncbi:rhomboid family intramembrane serine protease [Micromonospora sp. GCM10011542]|uniref:rhomboid family intramembrane serine protease n=1 Tax=Micromonospora sp. GCM10011542 TaxID=3317337 RepID=UPI0036161704
MDTLDTEQPPSEANATCFRHPRRETYVRCNRCERFICPDCMREAPVGFRCPECIRSENRTVRQSRTVFGGRSMGRPVATYALIGLNVLVYLAELVWPSVVDRFANLGTGLVDDSGRYFVDDGGSYDGYQLVGIAHGEWYRLLTSTFLHLEPTQGIFGITHILFNMYWLWLLGRILEERLGVLRFLAVYLLAALGGSVLFFLISPHGSAVGASGAIYGLAACYYVVSRRLRYEPLDRNRMIIWLTVWMVLSAGFTAWQGHLGGLLAGGVAAVGMAYAPQRHRGGVQAAVAVGLAAVLVALVVLRALHLGAAA